MNCCVIPAFGGGTSALADVTPSIATTAADGLENVERVPDVVLLYPDFTDITLDDTIQETRQLRNDFVDTLH